MKLSYRVDPFGDPEMRATTTAAIGLGQNWPSYGQPIIMLSNWAYPPDVLDLGSWIWREFQVVESTQKEWGCLAKLGFCNKASRATKKASQPKKIHAVDVPPIDELEEARMEKSRVRLTKRLNSAFRRMGL